jgi:hypothetical protein
VYISTFCKKTHFSAYGHLLDASDFSQLLPPPLFLLLHGIPIFPLCGARIKREMQGEGANPERRRKTREMYCK